MMASLVGRLLLRGLVVQKLGVANSQVVWTRTESGRPSEGMVVTRMLSSLRGFSGIGL